MESKFKLPTETVELPSKGLLYSKDSPLSSGKIEMKYMTAKEEDILTNQNYIDKGTVIDKLLESLIVTENVDYKTLLMGDKNAIMIAARVLSYGKDYEFQYRGKPEVADLSLLENKELHTLIEECKGVNSFTFKLPTTGNEVTFKLLTHQDEKNIEREETGLKKLNKDSSTMVTTRMKHIITSINGLSELKDVREFVGTYLLAKDARALRKFYNQINPDINLKVQVGDGEEDVSLPIGLSFFWPDTGL
jgi:hypothetical protein